MNAGTVEWFNASKGCAFISPVGGGDILVHISAVERSGLTSLSDGQKFCFRGMIDRRMGWSAAENLHVA